MATMVFAVTDNDERVQVGVRFFGGTERGRTFQFTQAMARMEGFDRFVADGERSMDRQEFTEFVRESQTVEFA